MQQIDHTFQPFYEDCAGDQNVSFQKKKSSTAQKMFTAFDANFSKKYMQTSSAQLNFISFFCSYLTAANLQVPKLTVILKTIAEMLQLKDKGMLSLEAASVVHNYPDMPQELLFGIVDARDDITSSESW